MYSDLQDEIKVKHDCVEGREVLSVGDAWKDVCGDKPFICFISVE
jgi:hypothetical protein